MQLGFLPVAVVCKIIQQQKRDGFVQKEEQYTKRDKDREYTK